MTDHWEHSALDAEMMRETIKYYNESDSETHVTVEGTPDPHPQAKTIDRWPETVPDGRFGHVWYGLNINGKTSDLVATFFLHQSEEGVTLQLEEIGIR
jgi:hypothetical protein